MASPIIGKISIKFDWQKKDVLILDNIKTLHGRATYEGSHRVLVYFVP